jgi:gliding motility-associated-like protein
MFASLSVCAQTDSAVIDSTTNTGVESKLIMPNTFTPNGDGHNDIFKAKEYRNLSEFHAYIFNRWGQKLYEWTDPAEGWDGTYHGSEVKTGVYFVLVKARGTDDVIYNIRKDVNLLRGDEQRR